MFLNIILLHLEVMASEYNTHDTGCICPICRESIHEGSDQEFVLKCTHKFHPRCIATWLVTSLTCPFCRRVASTTELEECILAAGGRFADNDTRFEDEFVYEETPFEYDNTVLLSSIDEEYISIIDNMQVTVQDFDSYESYVAHVMVHS